MTANANAPATSPLLFSAMITPAASLGRGGFLTVMAIIGGVNLVSGVMFFIIGAWPVTGFLGLDVLAVWLGFRAYRHQARAYEEIRLTAEELVVRQVDPKGGTRGASFNPYWVRLKRHELEDEGLVRLEVTSHGRAHVIAAALSPHERAEFARALEAALAKAKSAV